MIQPLVSNKILIRIFTGGHCGHVKPYFGNARGVIEATYGGRITIGCKNTDQFKEEECIETSKDFIDWFLEAIVWANDFS
jgi:hypothetical protein